MSRRQPHPGTKAAFIYNRSKKPGTYPTLHGDPFNGKQVVGLTKQQVRRDLLAMGIERRRVTQLAKTKDPELDGFGQVVHQSVVQIPQEDLPVAKTRSRARQSTVQKSQEDPPMARTGSGPRQSIVQKPLEDSPVARTRSGARQSTVQKPQEDIAVAKTRSGALRAESIFKFADTYKHLQIYTGDHDWVLYDANIPFENLTDAEVPDAVKRFARYEFGHLRIIIYNRSTRTFKLIRENGILLGTPIIYTADGPRQGKAPRTKGVKHRKDQELAARYESEMIASQPANANHTSANETMASKASVATANIRPASTQPSTTDHAMKSPAASPAKTDRITRSRINTATGKKNAEDNPAEALTAANTRKRKATALDDRDEKTQLSGLEPLGLSTTAKRLNQIFDQRQPGSTIKPAMSSEQKQIESEKSKSVDQALSQVEQKQTGSKTSKSADQASSQVEQKQTGPKTSKSADQASSQDQQRVPKQRAATDIISKKPASNGAATQGDKTNDAEAKARLRAYLNKDSSVSKLMQRGQGGVDRTAKSTTRTNDELRQQPIAAPKQSTGDAGDTSTKRKRKGEEVSNDNTVGDQRSEAKSKRAKSCHTAGSVDM